MRRPHTEALRLLNGQPVEGVAPDAVAMEPPLRRARGRDEKMFLLLIDLGPDAPAQLCRELRDVTARTFWTSEGSVTAALRRAVARATRFLFQTNVRLPPGQRRYGGLTCAAVQEEEVFLAQAGPSWAGALCEGALETFKPRDTPRLGSASYVDLRLTYFTPTPGDTLLIASRRLSEASSVAVFQRVLARQETDAVLDGLGQIGAGEDITLLLVRWPTESAPQAVEAPPRDRIRPPAHRPKSRPTPEPRPQPVPEEPPQPPREPVGRRLGQAIAGGAKKVGEGLRTLGRALGRGIAAIPGLLLQLARGLKQLLVKLGQGLGTLIQRMLPGRRGQGRRRPRREVKAPPPENSKAMAILALVILVIVMVVTVLAWETYIANLRRDQALLRASQHADQARAATEPETARTYWESTLAELESAETTTETVQLRQEAQAALDELNGVVWVEPILIHEINPQVVPRRLVAHGQSLFVLNTVDGSILHLTMNPSRDGVEAVETLVSPTDDVGTLIDMTWAGPEGARTTDTLLALEESQSLIMWNPAWHDPNEGPNRIYLGGMREQSAPVAIATYEGRLYVLDPGTRQIWRYLPEGGGYPSSPEPYFATEGPQPLENGKDMVIDGNVYILSANGSVHKYYDGERVPFTVSEVPDPEPVFVALAANAEMIDQPLILADSSDQRIVVLEADGTFSLQLRARDGAFQSLQAMALDSTTRSLFVIAGGRLYITPLVTAPPGSRAGG